MTRDIFGYLLLALLPPVITLVIVWVFVAFREWHLDHLPWRVYAMIALHGFPVLQLMVRASEQSTQRSMRQPAGRRRARVAALVKILWPAARGQQKLPLSPGKRILKEFLWRIIGVATIAGCYGIVAFSGPVILFRQALIQIWPDMGINLGFLLGMAMVCGFTLGVLQFFSSIHRPRSAIATAGWIPLVRRSGRYDLDKLQQANFTLNLNYWLTFHAASACLFAFVFFDTVVLIGISAYHAEATQKGQGDCVV